MGKLYVGCFFFSSFLVAGLVNVVALVDAPNTGLYLLYIVLAIVMLAMALYWFITTLLYAVTLAMRINVRKATPEEAKAASK